MTLKIIGWLQIVGGTLGYWVMAVMMCQTETVSGIMLLLLLIGLGLFSLSIYSGKKLLTEPANAGGIIYSICNQFLQLFQWSFLGYKLAFTSGLALTIEIEKWNFAFHFSALSSDFNMAINTNNDFFLKINLAALLIIFVLFEILHEQKKATELVIPDPVHHSLNNTEADLA